MQDNQKKHIISGMDKLVKSMLKTTMVTVSTQVEDSDYAGGSL